jgi:SAM-dependent methyltransferase
MSDEHAIRWNRESVQRLWAYHARHRPFAYFANVYGKAILRHSRLPLDRELEVLDFGCGPGFIWNHLLSLRARWNYTGLDFSSSSIEAARKQGARHERFRGAECVDRLPCQLPAGRFDVVLLVEVVEHLEDDDLDASLQEARRLLKAGGVLLVTTPNNEDLAQATKYCPECGAVFHEWQHVRTWMADSLAGRLAAHGFEAGFVKAVDFAGSDLARRIFRGARRLIRGEPMPHLIARFHKT